MSGQLRATCNNGQLFVTNGSIVFFVKNLSSRREKTIENFAAHETVRLLFSVEWVTEMPSRTSFYFSVVLLYRGGGKEGNVGQEVKWWPDSVSFPELFSDV